MCEARRYGEEMQCARCGLAWDVNDPDPPPCRTDDQVRQQHGREALDRIKNQLKEGREHD